MAIIGVSRVGSIGLGVDWEPYRGRLRDTEYRVADLSQLHTAEATTATPAAEVTPPKERWQGVLCALHGVMATFKAKIDGGVPDSGVPAAPRPVWSVYGPGPP